MSVVTRCLVLVLGLLWASVGRADEGNLEAGKRAYDKRCSQCHGLEGEADGPGANFMLPRPRVFADNPFYKFRTTPSGELPTDQDLFNIVERGIKGTGMPGFAQLPQQELWDIVAYLKTFNEDFADPDSMESAIMIEELVNPQPIPSSPESIAKGKEAFDKAKCYQCHGHGGRGNGADAVAIFDQWGKTPIVAANLHNKELLRGGAEPVDIFRTISTGLDGSPMASFRDSLSVEERWHVVNYVLSLSPAIPKVPANKISAVLVEGLIPRDDEEFWKDKPQSRFKTFPNIVEAPRLFWASVEYINVQAAYNPGEIVFRIQWDDRTHSTGSNTRKRYKDRDTSIYTKTDHPDQFALQFPAKANRDPKDTSRPYFLFGDSKKEADLWWWRADTNQFRNMNSKGYGTFTLQSLDSQELDGKVSYEDGRYTMVVRRAMATENVKKDVQFEAGAFTSIAFSVWDGSRGELGQRRALTSWYFVYLEPKISEETYVLPPIAFLLTMGCLGGLSQWLRRKQPKA